MDNPDIAAEVEKVKRIPVLFILGSGRSGTTLLQQLLNSHPNVVAPPESDFIVYLYPRFGKIRNWKDKDIVNFTNALFALPSISLLWLLKKGEIVKKLLSIKSHADYSLLCKMIFFQMKGDKENVLLFSIKDPRYSFFTETLQNIFPDISFIHIIRDPRDVVNGHIKRLNKKNAFFLAERWKGINKILEKRKKQTPDTFFTIMYEEMVVTPDKTLQALCEFLHIPYHNSIMINQFAQNMEAYKDTAYYKKLRSFHESTFDAINTSNLNKWKKEMSERDIAITCKVAGKYAKENYGYPMNTNVIKVSRLKLLGGSIQYYIWELYTKTRYNNYFLNSILRKRATKLVLKEYNPEI